MVRVFAGGVNHLVVTDPERKCEHKKQRGNELVTLVREKSDTLQFFRCAGYLDQFSDNSSLSLTDLPNLNYSPPKAYLLLSTSALNSNIRGKDPSILPYRFHIQGLASPEPPAFIGVQPGKAGLPEVYLLHNVRY